MSINIHKAKSNGEHPLGDMGQILFFIIFTAVWIVDTFLLRWTTFLSSSVHIAFRLPLAVSCVIIAFYFSGHGHVVVGGINKYVVKDGSFSRVRHPIYLGMMMIYIGFTIASFSLACFVLLGIIFLFYNAIAAFEEEYLMEKFGDEYFKYKKEVKRWIPITGYNKRDREI